ncbi:MAG: hypothetical protein KC619_21850, partial [Myxococcales bacterium]|nr:hypothetical protein [Myxococcales bacterium]
ALLRARRFACVRDGLVGLEKEQLTARCEVLFTVRERHERVYECKSCGALWVEACWTSGHMEVHYVHPLPSAELADFAIQDHELPAEPPPAHPYVHPEGITAHRGRPRRREPMGAAWSPTRDRLAFCVGDVLCLADPELGRVVVVTVETESQDVGFDADASTVAVAGGIEERSSLFDGRTLVRRASRPTSSLPGSWFHGSRARSPEVRCAARDLEARWGDAVGEDALLEVWRGATRLGRLPWPP